MDVFSPRIRGTIATCIHHKLPIKWVYNAPLLHVAPPIMLPPSPPQAHMHSWRMLIAANLSSFVVIDLPLRACLARFKVCREVVAPIFLSNLASRILASFFLA